MNILLRTTKILVYWLLLCVGCSMLYFYAGYPAQWDSIEKGMTRAQLHSKLGHPRACCSWDVKGDFYVYPTAWGEWEFLASPSPEYRNAVAATRIWLFIGPDRIRWVVKEDGSYLLGMYLNLF